MKILSLLFSLLLGGAVLFIVVKPWSASDKAPPGAGTVQSTAPASPSPAAKEATAGIETPGTLPAPKPATPPTAVTPEPSKPDSTDPKTHLRANEQAEAGQSAALNNRTEPAAATRRETKRYFKVKVRDAGTLEAGLLPTDAVVIRLEGIDAREADGTCKKEDGSSWPCGAKARAALAHFIRYRAVTCTAPPGAETKDFAAQCSVMGQDLSTWLVRQGWATPREPPSPSSPRRSMQRRASGSVFGRSTKVPEAL
jgi:endonuclease YncB( thermonuclease family)